jgi:hypothetical protein
MGEEVIPSKGKCKIVSECGKYGVADVGQGQSLYRLGKHGYRCGAMMNSEDTGALAYAIDAHEEEMRVMIADARREFGH